MLRTTYPFKKFLVIIIQEFGKLGGISIVTKRLLLPRLLFVPRSWTYLLGVYGGQLYISALASSNTATVAVFTASPWSATLNLVQIAQVFNQLIFYAVFIFSINLPGT